MQTKVGQYKIVFHLLQQMLHQIKAKHLHTNLRKDDLL